MKAQKPHKRHTIGIMIFPTLLLLILVSSPTFGCNSDFDCGFGGKCIKDIRNPGFQGICIIPTNQFGVRRYDIPRTGVTPTNVVGCQFNTDCSIGFSCVKRSGEIYGVCVK